MYCSKCGSTYASNCAFLARLRSGIQPGCRCGARWRAQRRNRCPIAAWRISPHWIPPVTRTYGGFLLRFVAHMIDGFLLGVVALAVLLPLFILTGLAQLSMVSIEIIRPIRLSSPRLFLDWSFLIGGQPDFGLALQRLLESSEWQGTVGRSDESRRDRPQAIAFPSLVLRALFSLTDLRPHPFRRRLYPRRHTEKKQALHDMIAGCLVLRS